MDNTSDSGSEAGGSIPSEGAFFLKIITDLYRVKIIFLFHFSTVYFWRYTINFLNHSNLNALPIKNKILY